MVKLLHQLLVSFTEVSFLFGVVVFFLGHGVIFIDDVVHLVHVIVQQVTLLLLRWLVVILVYYFVDHFYFLGAIGVELLLHLSLLVLVAIDILILLEILLLRANYILINIPEIII